MTRWTWKFLAYNQQLIKKNLILSLAIKEEHRIKQTDLQKSYYYRGMNNDIGISYRGEVIKEVRIRYGHKGIVKIFEIFYFSCKLIKRIF